MTRKFRIDFIEVTIPGATFVDFEGNNTGTKESPHCAIVAPDCECEPCDPLAALIMGSKGTLLEETVSLKLPAGTTYGTIDCTFTDCTGDAEITELCKGLTGLINITQDIHLPGDIVIAENCLAVPTCVTCPEGGSGPDGDPVIIVACNCAPIGNISLPSYVWLTVTNLLGFTVRIPIQIPTDCEPDIYGVVNFAYEPSLQCGGLGITCDGDAGPIPPDTITARGHVVCERFVSPGSPCHYIFILDTVGFTGQIAYDCTTGEATITGSVSIGGYTQIGCNTVPGGGEYATYVIDPLVIPLGGPFPAAVTTTPIWPVPCPFDSLSFIGNGDCASLPCPTAGTATLSAGGGDYANAIGTIINDDGSPLDNYADTYIADRPCACCSNGELVVGTIGGTGCLGSAVAIGGDGVALPLAGGTGGKVILRGDIGANPVEVTLEFCPLGEDGLPQEDMVRVCIAIMAITAGGEYLPCLYGCLTTSFTCEAFEIDTAIELKCNMCEDPDTRVSACCNCPDLGCSTGATIPVYIALAP